MIAAMMTPAINNESSHWSLRITRGKWANIIAAIRPNASGSTLVDVDVFQVTASNAKGFVGVSQAVSRYFEFSNGDLFWPIGPANANAGDETLGSGLNIERPW
jgi:hypothetical protein